MSDNRLSVSTEGSHSFYRASSAGMCIRALAGIRSGMDPLPPNDDMKRRFADGHLHEDSIIEAIETHTRQSVVRQQEEWTVEISPKITVVGHVDGIVADELVPVEAKSAAQDSYKDWEKGIEHWFNGDKAAYRLGYADQWTLTLAGYGVSHGYYAVKNKNSGKVLVRDIGPQSSLEEIKVRLLRADLDGRRGRLPECDRYDYFCPLRYLHDEERKKAIAGGAAIEEGDEDLEALGVAYLEAREAADRAESVRKELGRRIAEAMGNREKVACSTLQISMTTWTRTTLDKEKLSEVVGDLTPYEKVASGAYAKVTARKKEE